MTARGSVHDGSTATANVGRARDGRRRLVKLTKTEASPPSRQVEDTEPTVGPARYLLMTHTESGRSVDAWLNSLSEELQSDMDRLLRPDPSESQAQPEVLNVTINNGPVFHGSVSQSPFAWNNNTVTQVQSNTRAIAPGFVTIAEAAASVLERLPMLGLLEEDQHDATMAANDVLDEVVRSEPDQGKVRRALAALRRLLLPVAMGIVQGAGDGAREWAETLVKQINLPS